MVRHQCPVRMGGVVANPGDVVFADLDGICVIPQAQADGVVQAALRQGMKASEAFAKFRVL